jgi:hypothetical protein
MKQVSVLLLASLSACSLHFGGTFGSGPLIDGSGLRIEVERSAPDFRRIDLRIPAQCRVRVGEGPELRIAGDDNLLPLLTTEVEGETLVIAMRPGNSYRPEIRLEIDIATPELEALHVKGSGDVEVDGIHGAEFEASVSGSGDLRLRGEAGRFSSTVMGSGDVDLQVEAGELVLSVSGSGDFSALGLAERLEAAISGSGDMDLGRLEAREAHLRISGSGDMHVWATERLEIDVSGSGDVSYRGHPRVQQRVRGSGDVYSVSH